MEAEGLYAESAEKYRNALLLNPRDHKALYMWANMLSQQASQPSLKTPLSVSPVALLRQVRKHVLDIPSCHSVSVF
jgi:hypothetical protein